MDEDQRLVLERERGGKARAILDSGLYKEAIGRVEEYILELWKKSPVQDTDGQVKLRLKWQCLQEIKGYLANVMTTGELAERQIEHKRTMADRARNAVRAFRRANG